MQTEQPFVWNAIVGTSDSHACLMLAYSLESCQLQKNRTNQKVYILAIDHRLQTVHSGLHVDFSDQILGTGGYLLLGQVNPKLCNNLCSKLLSHANSHGSVIILRCLLAQQQTGSNTKHRVLKEDVLILNIIS